MKLKKFIILQVENLISEEQYQFEVPFILEQYKEYKEYKKSKEQ